MPFWVEYEGHGEGVALSYFTGASVTLKPGDRIDSTVGAGLGVRALGQGEHEDAHALLFGRVGRCLPRIASAGVARHHFILFRSASAELIGVDLGSTNGTRINGRLLAKDERVVVRDGDTLDTAGFYFKVHTSLE